MKYLASLACMCLFLFVTPEIQSQQVSCNGCTTTVVHGNASEDSYMYIESEDGTTRGVVKGYQESDATVCDQDLTQ